MHDPYIMVLLSIIAALLLGIGLLVYRYIYPKKNSNLFMLLLLLSLLPLISILRPGTYESGDLTQNVYKAISFYHSLSEGNFFPQWAGELNATYGYPLFTFIYPLPFYFISFFHFIGFSFIASIKLLIASTFIISGVGMYLWMKEEFGQLPAFTAALFYLYAPYHLIDMHFRVSIGELVSFAFLPFVLLSIAKYLENYKKQWFIATTTLLSLLLLCNQAIALFSFGFFALYTLFIWFKKERRSVIKLMVIGCSFIFALALSAFYWLPVITESQYTHQDLYSQTVGFVQIHELLYSPWRYGFLFQGHYGELSFLIGYIQLLIICLTILFLLKKKFTSSEKQHSIFYLTTLLVVCLLMLPFSKPVWDHVAILRNFQFTYRLLLFVSLFTAVLAGIIATKINKKFVYVLCIAVVLQTILNWGNRGMMPVSDTFFQKTLPLSTAGIEGFQPAVPKWVNANSPWEKIIPAQHLQVLHGHADIKEIERTATKHRYAINVAIPTYFKENTWYFPGWTASVNDRVIPINYENPQYPGVISFELPKGNHQVTIEFKNTSIKTTAEHISIGAFILFCFLLL